MPVCLNEALLKKDEESMKGLYIVTPDWDDTAKMVEVTEKA